MKNLKFKFFVSLHNDCFHKYLIHNIALYVLKRRYRVIGIWLYFKQIIAKSRKKNVIFTFSHSYSVFLEKGNCLKYFAMRFPYLIYHL